MAATPRDSWSQAGGGDNVQLVLYSVVYSVLYDMLLLVPEVMDFPLHYGKLSVPIWF